MKRLSLVSILLPVLVVPFIMTYRLSPLDTPYWLFGLIFLCMTLFIGTDLISISQELFYKVKSWLLLIIIALVLGSAFFSVIVVRHNVAPVYTVHDIILQQEAAMRFLLDGKNPYVETYFGTPLESWHYSDTEVNPALYHFVMEPFYLLFAFPFYFVTVHSFGFFDARIPLYFLFFGTLFLAYFIPKDFEKKLLFVILLAFNPAILAYTLEGRSDIFVFGFLFIGLYFLLKKRENFSAASIGLAFAVKQSAWPLFPFYCTYLYLQSRSFKKTLKSLSVFLLTFLVIVMPFLIWNPQAFIDSTVLYLSGSGTHSYPISGYGFGMVLKEFGFIKNVNEYYPFIIWQVLICAPLLIFFIKYQKKHNSIRVMILLYASFLFVYWYFSRYFNNSHAGYLTVVFITAYFWPEDEKYEKA